MTPRDWADLARVLRAGRTALTGTAFWPFGNALSDMAAVAGDIAVEREAAS